jgi:hypothetical protein
MDKELTLLEEVDIYNSIGDGPFKPASVIGARSIKQKMRLIFMAPFSQNIRELQYVYALMDWLLDNSTAVDGWRGPSSTMDAIQRQMVSGVTHISTDFTAMDTSVGPEQVAMFMDVYQHAFKAKYRPGFCDALKQIAHIPVICGVVKVPGQANVSRNSYELVVADGDHGLFSGLGWTNLIETGLSLLLDAEFRQYYPVVEVEVNGDDGEKTIDGRRNLDQVADRFAYLARRMGFTCNPSKQWVSYDEIRYLQRIYSPETEQHGYTFGAYPFTLVMNSIKNPERPSNLSKWQQVERVLNIANNNWGHPYWDSNIIEIVRGEPGVVEWLATGEGQKDLEQSFALSASTGTLEGSNFESQSSFNDLMIVKYLQEHTSEILSALGW